MVLHLSEITPSFIVEQIYRALPHDRSTVILVAGAPLPKDLRKRSLEDSPNVFFDSRHSLLLADARNVNGQPTNLLSHYRLITPPLLLMTLVAILILFPIVWLGFSALASIKSPQRMEVPKTIEKKG
jgi:hypothetical protein